MLLYLQTVSILIFTHKSLKLQFLGFSVFPVTTIFSFGAAGTPPQQNKGFNESTWRNLQS